MRSFSRHPPIDKSLLQNRTRGETLEMVKKSRKKWNSSLDAGSKGAVPGSSRKKKGNQARKRKIDQIADDLGDADDEQSQDDGNQPPHKKRKISPSKKKKVRWSEDVKKHDSTPGAYYAMLQHKNKYKQNYYSIQSHHYDKREEDYDSNDGRIY